jgi:hypothetical protein
VLVKQVEEEEANVERACSLALLALQYLLYCSASKHYSTCFTVVLVKQ